MVESHSIYCSFASRTVDMSYMSEKSLGQLLFFTQGKYGITSKDVLHLL